jgi:UDP-GlcNAc:undecaprenyl-phosphate/decaprenyl-phosphate GlcNAc-1-phosphate transferase
MYTIFSLLGFGLTILATVLVRRFAISKGVVDDPSVSDRKIHKKATPLLGGVAIYLGLAITLLLALHYGYLEGNLIANKHVFGLLAGGLWLIIGGYLDDKYVLSPKQQIIWPILAVLTVIVAGIGIESFSNPLGGQLFLDTYDLTVFSFKEIPYKFTFPADLFTFVWLLAIIYAAKFFDGLDGLVSGITVIGAFTVFFASLLPQINQPQTALISIIVAACFLGFLIFNFNPASIFLGEGGSTLAGFLIGALAIIAESKVATTLVIMALPLLDLIWAVTRRVFIEGTSPTQADKKHIHHRLLDSGFTHKGAVLLLYAWAIALGLLAWLYQSTQAGILLFASLIIVISFAFYLVYRVKKYA